MAKPDQNNGCGWAIAVVLGLIVLGQCSKDGSGDQYSDTESTLYDQSSGNSAESLAMYVTAGSVNSAPVREQITESLVLSRMRKQ